tara:strand:+ start:73 stop:294 length:222 start_codon:yes stop_codon:yes gene_type:complete
MSDISDSLKAIIGVDIDTEYMLVKGNIDNILKKGWQQVEERIEVLRELEAVKEEMDNKWEEYDELKWKVEDER